MPAPVGSQNHSGPIFKYRTVYLETFFVAPFKFSSQRRFRRQVMLDGEKEIAVNQYQLIFKNIKKIQLDKYYKVSLNLGSVLT